MQIWPWCRNEPNAPAEAASARSAPGRTTSALLPPSSRWARLRWRAAASPTLRPAAVEPVKEMTETSGASTTATPTSVPPGSSCSSPAGSPASSKTRTSATPPQTAVRGSGFEQHGVAQREGRGDGADREDQREVERRDHGDDADRATAREGPVRRVGGQHLALRVRRQRGGLEALRCRDVGLEPGLRGYASRLAHDPPLDLLGVGLPQLAGAAQHGGPLLRRPRRPLLLRRRGPGRGPGHVVGTGHADLPEDVSGGGLDHVLHAAGAGGPAVEVDLAGPGGGVEQGHESSCRVGVRRATRAGGSADAYQGHGW